VVRERRRIGGAVAVVAVAQFRNGNDALGYTPGDFAKRREVIEHKGDALRSFARECKKCKRAKNQGWSVGKLEGQPGGEALQKDGG
jgi:hypothetical protein